MTLQVSLLAMALLALAAFALRDMISKRSAPSDVSARIEKQGASPFLGNLLMGYAYWVLTPIGKLANSLKISPNIFSWTCLLLGLGSGVAAAKGHIPAAGGLSIISALFDTLDGMVARAQGIASDAGEVLDAAVDRYTEFFFLGGLCIYYRFEPWAMVLVLAALLGSFLVSYSQAKSEALNISIPKGWMRRPERATYLGTGAFLSPIIDGWLEAGDPQPLHYLMLFAVLVVAIFANATAIHRFNVLYEKLKAKAKRP